MIKPGRFLRSLLGLIAGAWLAILLILLPLAQFMSRTFDEKTVLDPDFLDFYGYKSWSDYAFRVGAPFLGLVLVLTALSCAFGMILHTVLYFLNWRRLYNYMSGGTVVVATFCLLGVLYLANGAPSFPTAVGFSLFLAALIVSALFALVTLLVFWLIRRPDKDLKPLP
jgi:hypothetical protein